jgi:hypothetical protein
MSDSMDITYVCLRHGGSGTCLLAYDDVEVILDHLILAAEDKTHNTLITITLIYGRSARRSCSWSFICSTCSHSSFSTA